MNIDNERLIELAIGWFKDVEENCRKLTTGNVSHNSRQIQGFALHCREFLEKYKQDENKKE